MLGIYIAAVKMDLYQRVKWMLPSHNDAIHCFFGKDYEIVRALVKVLPFLFEQ